MIGVRITSDLIGDEGFPRHNQGPGSTLGSVPLGAIGGRQKIAGVQAKKRTTEFISARIERLLLFGQRLAAPYTPSRDIHEQSAGMDDIPSY